MADSETKPSANGLSRAFKIVGGAIGIGVLIIVAFAFMQKGNGPKEPPKVEIGRVLPPGSEKKDDISEGTQQMLNRVQTSEAEAARRKGNSYMPDARLGAPDKISPEAPPAPPVLLNKGPGPSANEQFQVRTAQSNTQRTPEQQAIDEGLVRQIELIARGMQPATTQVVVIKMADKKDDASRAPQGVQGAQITPVSGVAPSVTGNKGREIVGGDVIVPAVITTAIDTDVTKFAMAEITGGPLKGALLRGAVVPLNQSGDIEDVGIRFTSMRVNDKMYAIDAIALNEATANDAMGGDVDRKIMSRYVMPILVAGLAGASTYFTALGTPSTSLATGTQPANGAVIVNQAAATQEQAINQGLGGMAAKSSQMATRMVEKQANKPNRVTVPAMTTVGVIFNATVYESAAK